MLFRAYLLHVDPATISSIEYVLMLARMLNDGRMDARSIFEGAHMGYTTADSLKELFIKANVDHESVEQLARALSLNVPLAFVGILVLVPKQLRKLGFQTLSNMAESVALEQ
jgi:hypothetical protein